MTPQTLDMSDLSKSDGQITKYGCLIIFNFTA